MPAGAVGCCFWRQRCCWVVAARVVFLSPTMVYLFRVRGGCPGHIVYLSMWTLWCCSVHRVGLERSIHALPLCFFQGSTAAVVTVVEVVM